MEETKVTMEEIIEELRDLINDPDYKADSFTFQPLERYVNGLTNLDPKEDFNLRENADITWLAIECSKSLDPTDLKEWFVKKFNNEKPF